MKTKYIIIGSYFSEHKEKTIKSKIIRNNFSISNIIYERKLFLGFQENHVDFIFLSSPFLGFYKIDLLEKTINLRNEKHCFYVSYPQTSLGKMFVKPINIVKAFKNNVLKNINTDDCVVLLTMEMNYGQLKSSISISKILKKRGIKVHICAFCPDISNNVIDLNHNHTFIYSFFKKLIDKLNYKMFKRANSFVFFTKFMPDYFKIKQNYLILNGIQNITPSNNTKAKYPIVFYSGKLQEKNGILVLLDAFKIISKKSKIELYICGNGPLEEFVKKISQENKNIHFYGFVNHKKIEQITNVCNVICSLRDPNWAGVLYSFPSKFMEALSSLKPVVSFLLPTYDESIRDFTYICDQFDGQSLSKSILDAFEDLKPNRIINQNNFLSKYSPKESTKKIIDLTSLVKK